MRSRHFIIHDPSNPDAETAILRDSYFRHFVDDFIIIDTAPESRFMGFAWSYRSPIDLGSLEPWMKCAIGETGELGFAVCSPLPTSFRVDSELLGLSRVGAIGCVYFPPLGHALTEGLEVRRRSGPRRQWAFGSCNERFSSDAPHAFEFAGFLHEPKNLRCLFNEDGGAITVITKPFRDIDGLIDAFLRSDVDQTKERG
jgi:hypothetical protein